jgi:DNA-binding SARP family transcriptional activator
MGELDPGAEIWLDVLEYTDRLAECRTHVHASDQACPDCLSLPDEAAALYQDDFVADFTLCDCPAFGEWQYLQGEGMRDELASALERLANGFSAQGEYERAIVCARRWVALDPLNEPAQRLLMHLHATAGQRGFSPHRRRW